MTYSIAETAKRFSVTPHTLRFYDKEGLLPFVARTPSGLRFFTESDFEWLKLIMCLKNTGMKIKDIKHFIDLCMEGETTFEERLDFIRRQKASIEAQMAELQKNHDTILHKEQYYLNAIQERGKKSRLK